VGLAGLGLGDDWMRAVIWDNGARLMGIRCTGPRPWPKRYRPARALFDFIC
jgi:hypothetical protein